MVNEQTVLTSIHVLAATLLVGAVFAMSVGMGLAGRSGDLTRVRETLRLLVFLGTNVFPVLAAVILATGIWLTIDYYDFGDLWILLGTAGLVVAFSIGFLYMRPRGHAALKALDQTGGPPPGLPVPPVVPAVNLLILVSVVVIMVIRPS
jgi:uncharacterized membrane protein